MTPSQRLEAYWQLYFCMEGEKTLNLLDKEGMCYAMDWIYFHGGESFNWPDDLKELYSLKPENLFLDYWFPCTEEGYNQRQALILKAIELLYRNYPELQTVKP